MSLTELPFHLQGNIFGCAMPFGKYDPNGDNFYKFKHKKISVIVLLAEDKECEQKAGCNLRELYIQEGYKVIYFPIPDRDIPSKENLEHFTRETINCAEKGHNIVIHCSAGIGRTGMFAAKIAKKVLYLSGKEAIDWVRQNIPGAVETPEQEQLIIDDTNENLYKKCSKLITELTAILQQEFGQGLLSIVLFGSIVKSNFTKTSDIDVIVVCENLIEDWRARDIMILAITEDIELKYSTPIHMNIVSKDEISHAIESANPLLLEIYDANRIIYDKDKFFSNLLRNFEFNLHRWHARKIEKGLWKIPGLAVIESD